MKTFKIKPPIPSSKLPALALFLSIIVTQHLTETSALHFRSIGYRQNETEHMAMLAIRSGLMDHPEGVLRSWNRSRHHCFWEGVICGAKDKRVNVLFLPARGLAGTLSPFIGNLSFLRGIVLQDNNLHGGIPPEIGRLFRLEELDLHNNSLQQPHWRNSSQHIGLHQPPISLCKPQ